MEKELKEENRKYIVAKSDENEIIGFAGILINYDTVELMNIVVRKKYRNQGIGQKLLEEIIKIARKTKLEILNLEVNERNIYAIKLYEKNGFKKIGMRPKYYNNQNDAILMQKEI